MNNSTTVPKPIFGNIQSCQQYAHELIKKSSQPNRTLAYIWTRFLTESFVKGGSK